MKNPSKFLSNFPAFQKIISNLSNIQINFLIVNLFYHYAPMLDTCAGVFRGQSRSSSGGISGNFRKAAEWEAEEEDKCIGG